MIEVIEGALAKPAEGPARHVTGRELSEGLRDLALKEYGADTFEIVAPSISILAEPPVTIVDAVTARHGTKAVATAYLEYLYSPEGQAIAAKHHYRPRDKAIQAKYAENFASGIQLFTLDEVFGSWSAAQKKFFADGGIFDQIYGAAR